ncbi:YeiH family protein [Mesorhizobium xinjiangense]|uniref:YeiH family protein n=1 Tax=Mesorhizobium xinjiangense TaxID=2678685 RepID=UPI001F1A3A92|nr:putative sulfate exporter family transporter [Mesorhizobium xinjiangense]
MMKQSAIGHGWTGADGAQDPDAPAAAPQDGPLAGIVLAGAIAAGATGLAATPGLAMFSPMILAVLVGIGFNAVVGVPARAAPGLAFALRRVLRFAIILLGFQLTGWQLAEVGLSGMAVIAATLAAAFVFTVRLGRALGVDRKLAELIAAGTSICGASAVIAANTATRAPDEDVSYAVACVTICGSLAMLIYPLLAGLLELGPHAYGLWTGASIHEIAQVVAASFQHSEAAGEFGVIAKLARVMLLAPVVMLLGSFAARRAAANGDASGAKAPFPWFILGFAGVVGLNSFAPPAPWLHDMIVQATAFLLSLSLAAMGLGTDIGRLKAKGLRPLMLALAATLFISAFSLFFVVLCV